MAQIAAIGLGGHSFIEELGNDPKSSFEEQTAIVAACLDLGVTSIDTTFFQEREALGRVLEQMGRRDEAHIMAWNFFRQPGVKGVITAPAPYEPGRIEEMLEELRTDRIDTLVVHVHEEPGGIDSELELAKQWKAEGKIGRIAIGMVRVEDLERLPEGHGVTCALAPYNAFHREAEGAFVLARRMGMEVIALSPFIRGWKLDEIGEDKTDASGLLLRWAAQHNRVDKVIVSMRKRDYVQTNIDMLALGQLSFDEQERLARWVNLYA